MARDLDELDLRDILKEHATDPFYSPDTVRAAPFLAWDEYHGELILKLHREKKLAFLVKRILDIAEEESTTFDLESEEEKTKPSMNSDFAQDLLKGDDSKAIQYLIANGYSEGSTVRPKPEPVLPYSTYFANIFWRKRNYGQRAAMYPVPLLCLTAGILGAVSSHSATLTTAGATAAKILPAAVTAFAGSHAIPPAALAFYILAGALAITAILLFLASTLYRTISNRVERNSAFTFIQ